MRIYNMPLSKRYGSYEVLNAMRDLGIVFTSPSSKVVHLPPVFLESLEYMLWTRRSPVEALAALKAHLAKQDAKTESAMDKLRDTLTKY